MDNDPDQFYLAKETSALHNCATELGRDARTICIRANANATIDRNGLAQMYRSGTSVGANVREARFAESRADYIHKLKIAEKELAEFAYWLGVLCSEPVIIEAVDSDRLVARIREVRALLSSTIRTLKNRPQ